MLISLEWIKEFTKIPDMSPKELGEKFTLATAEVEEVLSSGEVWQKLQVAQIEKIIPHPNADSLNLVTFSLGNDSRQVVCGAKNVRVGLKVPYAPVGVTLPNGMTLTPKSIRGVMSEGMLCSQEELGLENTIDGLLEFSPETKVGMTLSQLWNKQGGVIFNVDNKSLTHRPDLWGHYGMAREFSTIFATTLADPFGKDWMQKMKQKVSKTAAPLTVKVEKDCAGLAYWGISIDGVKVNSSPDWMVLRLEEAGLRSINSLVDISNYVMLELGIPNHIFDRQKIGSNQLSIHALNQTTSFKTLDGVERTLQPGDTVISDAAVPLVLAGIMGGNASAVDENTKNIFIEVANWKAAMVRRTSVRLGLRTDSSQRYEKSLDSALLERSLYRLVELVLQLNPTAKINGQVVMDGEQVLPLPKRQLQTSADSIARQLGKQIETNHILKIFTGLGFEVQSLGDVINVTVPSWRATKDVECEADLVEEIGRIIGYDNIVPVSPALGVLPVRLGHFQELSRKIEDFLVYHARAYQVMTYPLTGKDSLQNAKINSQNCLKLINALSEDHDRMRPSLIGSLLDAVVVNRKYHDEFRLFELGRVYLPATKKEDFVKENPFLAMVFFQKNDEKNIFMDLVNNCERMLSHINVAFDFTPPNAKFPSTALPQGWTHIHPHQCLDVRMMGKVNGSIFSVHPLLLRQYKIKGQVAMALFDMSELALREVKSKIKYKPLPKFPSTTFDCTVITPKTTPAQEVLRVLDKLRLPEMEWAKIVGVFDLEQNGLAVTVKTYLIDREKTLSPERIKALEETIISQLEKSGFPLKK